MHTIRIEPEITSAVLAWWHRNHAKTPLDWSKNEGDTFTTFTGSKASVSLIGAFKDGWESRDDELSGV